MTRELRVLGVRPKHPRAPERSYIALDVSLLYLRGEPVEEVRLTEDDAIALIREAANAIAIVRASNARKEEQP